MSELHKYVPTVASNKEVQINSINTSRTIPQATICLILFGGDQLTVVRALSAKKAKISSPDPVCRLDGLIPVVEEWHSKVVLLGVGCKWNHIIFVHFIDLLISLI